MRASQGGAGYPTPPPGPAIFILHNLQPREESWHSKLRDVLTCRNMERFSIPSLSCTSSRKPTITSGWDHVQDVVEKERIAAEAKKVCASAWDEQRLSQMRGQRLSLG